MNGFACQDLKVLPKLACTGTGGYTQLKIIKTVRMSPNKKS